MEVNLFNIINDEADIKEVWNEFVGVKLNSSNKALCPFHNEKTPSLSLNISENYFYCFGCGCGGDVIKLVELIENVSPLKACKLIAKRLNIAIPSLSKKKLKKIQKQRAKWNEILKVYNKALDYFVNNLKAKHINFLKSKYGLSENTIKTFKLGFTDGRLRKQLEQNFSRDLLVKTGLFYLDKGSLKDNFRNRIIIPYLKEGQVVSFTGRALEFDNPVKYKNLISTKDYIADSVRQKLLTAIYKDKKTLIITEGLMDTLAGYQAGYSCVGLGTNGLTKNKKKELYKMLNNFDNIVLIFDSEEAKHGLNGAIKTAKTILKDTKKLIKIAQLPRAEGIKKIDMADFLLGGGKLEPIINNSINVIELLISEIKNSQDPLKAIDKANKITSLIAYINEQYSNFYIDRIREEVSKVEGCKKTTLNKSNLNKLINEEKEKGKHGIEEFTPLEVGEAVLNYEKKQGKKWFYSLKEGVFYYYDSGVWKKEEQGYLQQIIRRVLRYHNYRWESNKKVAEIMGVLQQDLIISRKLEKKFNAGLDPDKRFINLKNGMLDWRSLELIDHKPKYYSLFQLTIKYKPNASCPLWERTLKDWIPDKDTIKFLQEYAGYCLIPDTSYHKAVVLHGNGSNGKSTFLEVLKSLYSRENCSDKSLHEIGQRFGTATIKDKLVNIAPDIDPSYLESTGKIKSIIAGEGVSGEYKHGAIFDFIPVVRLLFSANELPKTRDKSKGWLRRIEIINFPNEFEGKDKDPKLKEKLLKEKAGIFNWALEGLQRLKKQGDFTTSKSMQRAKDDYSQANDTIRAYISDKIEITEDPDDFVATSELYRDYKSYCLENNLTAQSRKVFSRRLKQEIDTDKTRKMVEGKYLRGFTGIQAEIFNISLVRKK